MLNLRDRSTVSTGLKLVMFNTCMLPSGATVVYDDGRLYVLGENGKKRQVIPRLCEHVPDAILGMEIEGKEYISVSCILCENIKLVERIKHTDTRFPWSLFTRSREGVGDVTVALSGCHAYRMCTAGNSINYIIDGHGVISELDTSTQTFKINNNFSVDIHDRIYSMCYIPGHDLLVLGSFLDDSLNAVSLSDRQIIWRHDDWTVEDAKFRPGALEYLPTHMVLMVGDMRWNLRIVCVRPETGETLQVIRPPVVGELHGFHLRGQRLFIVHNPNRTLRLSTFTVEGVEDSEASSNEETPTVPAGVIFAAQETVEDKGVDHCQGLTSAAQETVEDKGVDHGQGLTSAAQEMVEDKGVDHGQGLTSAAQEMVEDKGVDHGQGLTSAAQDMVEDIAVNHGQGLTSAAQKLVADKGFTRVTREVHGEPYRLQARGSDVSLEGPSGVNATVEVITYTDNSKIQHLLNTNQTSPESVVDSPLKSERVHVDSPLKSYKQAKRFSCTEKIMPQNECLVSPVVELKVTSKETGTRAKGKFKLTVPHFIKDVGKFLNYIRVRIAGDKTQTSNLKRADSSTSTDDYFDVKENFIEISTSHPGVFIVTVEGINCCGSSASIYLFGSLKYYPDNSTLATIKVYISSYRAEIQDYMQSIAETEKIANSRHLETSEIDLSLEPYEPEKSELTLRIRPEVSTEWAPFMDDPVELVLKLNKALKFKGQHICGQPTREVAAFSVKSSTQKIFIGKVEAKVNVVTSAGGTEENTRDVLVHLDPSVRGKKIQEIPPDVSAEKLSDGHLVKLSKLVTNPMDLSTLGVIGLGIPDNEVQLCIQDHRGNFASAVHSVLRTWRARQGDPRREQENLIEAFTKAGMVGLANQVLG